MIRTYEFAAEGSIRKLRSNSSRSLFAKRGAITDEAGVGEWIDAIGLAVRAPGHRVVAIGSRLELVPTSTSPYATAHTD